MISQRKVEFYINRENNKESIIKIKIKIKNRNNNNKITK
jgi:hypothetical protein